MAGMMKGKMKKPMGRKAIEEMVDKTYRLKEETEAEPMEVKPPMKSGKVLTKNRKSNRRAIEAEVNKRYGTERLAMGELPEYPED